MVVQTEAEMRAAVQKEVDKVAETKAVVTAAKADLVGKVVVERELG